ncbi:proteasome subunit [Theileria orientalis strain Shintoku]|uniref:Proteasome subunit n=1 Tax=Theileria orientalis strain Shintoku TaxID=869250 RepID=J4DQ39_THEOR|nr:proteasome subunit [Theileria orientalis strain Shintoku]PVC53678.1 proteasome subunit [Theileria orientalis]BAM41784.1 proteasome subunit [Theileria orientalis strain Shintoku]|eukprot:XP_009692085.1 proteasome subunit [Theileria orientalis strain Shintoku]
MDIDEILFKYNTLTLKKLELDDLIAPKCFPGAKIGCCSYPEDLMTAYVQLNDYILGNQPHDPDSVTTNHVDSQHKLKILSDERVMYVCENVVYVLAYYLIETGQTDSLLGLLIRNEEFFSILPQAKTAKMVRSILERLSQVVKDLNVLYKIFSIYRGWCDSKKRKFLGLRIELKLVVILILMRRFTEASKRLNALQNEVRLLEDKSLLLDVYLVQAKFYLLLRDFTKMKVFVSNAKNTSTNINTPVYVTSEIDLLSGILYLCEKDYKTAYSYLFESFEGFHMSLCNAYSYLYPNLNRVKRKTRNLTGLEEPKTVETDDITTEKVRFSCHPTTSDISPVFFTFYNLYDYHRTSDKVDRNQKLDSVGSYYIRFYSMVDFSSDELEIDETAHFLAEPEHYSLDVSTIVGADERKLVQSLKYLMLSAVLSGQAGDLNTLLGAKNKLKYSNHLEIVMIKKIGNCYKESSLINFEKLLTEYREVIMLDPVLQHEVQSLYDALLEKNILRLLKPYSIVECEFVARKLDLPVERVERKLAEMILDNKLKGTIDQGSSTLEVYDEVEVLPIYENVTKSIGHMTEVIETLYEKAKLAI